MKKIIASIIAIALWMGFVNAQATDNTPKKWDGPQNQNRSFEKGPMNQQKWGKYRFLNLTKEQKAQAKSINETFHSNLAKLESNDKISLGDYKAQLASLKKDHKAQLEGILTPEQKEKIARQKNNLAINGKVNATARLERLKLTLGLNDDQVAKLKAQQADARVKIKAIRENETLLPEQKKEQMKSLMQQQKESLKSVLTADQQTKLDSMKKNFHPGPGGFRGRPWGPQGRDFSK
jgi:hypothetical protein